MRLRIFLRSPCPWTSGAVALLCAAVWLLYFQVGTHDFIIFDDPIYVYGNSYTVEGLTWTSFVWAFTNMDAANWHPLTWLSHMVDVELFGLEPGGHLLVNAGFHALNVLLLFGLVWRMTARWGAALFVAMVFAVHPLNVETVAWAAQRKSLLNMALLLMALHAWCEYARRPSFRSYGFCLIAFELSLLAKSMSVTLPLLLLLLDAWPLGRARFARPSGAPRSWLRDGLRLPDNWLALLLEKLPFVLIAGWLGVVTIVAQVSAGAAPDLAYSSVFHRVLNVSASYGAYLSKAVYPASLGLFYPRREFDNWVQYLPVWGLAAGLIVVTVVATWRRHRAAVGLLWFVVTLLPVCGLLQVGDQSMADRYFYLPGIGLSIAAVVAADAVRLSAFLRAFLFWVVVPAHCLVLGILAHAQIMLWSSGTLILGVTVENCGPSPTMATNLVATYSRYGMREQALRMSERAVRWYPRDATIIGNHVACLLRVGRLQEAYVILKQLESAHLSSPGVAGSLATAYYRMGDSEKAMRYIQLVRLMLPTERTWDLSVEREKATLNDPGYKLESLGGAPADATTGTQSTEALLQDAGPAK